MKKIILVFLAAIIGINYVKTQDCVRDSSILISGDVLSPMPWSTDAPFYNLHPACIGEPYNQSITINVPTDIFGVPVTDLSIPTSFAVHNKPNGVTYACDPPNCVFNSGTLGCISLFGTPISENMVPDTLDMHIDAVYNTPFGPLAIDVPSSMAQGIHFYMLLNAPGNCLSSNTNELSDYFSRVNASPNPFMQETNVQVQSNQNGAFRFAVFNFLGRQMYTREVELKEGNNQFYFDGSGLPSGIYIYSIGNDERRSVGRFVKM
ncbi:MAG: T9SS type A sorting domain-containing protein [Saprospiraceae bacterium]